MVGTADIILYPRIADIAAQFGRYKEVIQTPADIPFAGTRFIRPPAVRPRHVAMHMAEGIHIARFHKTIHPGTFFRQKARIEDILPGAGKVYLLMRDIEIAADHYGLISAELFGIVKEGVKKAQLVGNSLEYALGQFFPAIGK